MQKTSFLFLLLVFTSFKSLAQRIFYTNSTLDADIVLHEVKQKTDADLIIKKIKYNDEVKKGFWREVKTKSDADLIVFITDKNTSDVKKVFFTKYDDEVKY